MPLGTHAHGSGVAEMPHRCSDGEVRRRSVAGGGGDPNDGWVPHVRDNEVAKGVVVSPLSLPSTLTEPDGGLCCPVAVRLRRPRCAQGAVLVEVETEWNTRWVEVEAAKPPRGEVLGLVNLDERAGLLVEEVARQRREPLGLLLFPKPAKGIEDGVEHIEGWSRLRRKPEMAALVEPRHARPYEGHPVFGSGVREGTFTVTDRHETNLGVFASCQAGHKGHTSLEHDFEYAFAGWTGNHRAHEPCRVEVTRTAVTAMPYHGRNAS